MGKTIKTIDYGELPVAIKNDFLLDEVIGEINTTDGKYYNVKKTFNGQLVAILS